MTIAAAEMTITIDIESKQRNIYLQERVFHFVLKMKQIVIKKVANFC